eukprot:9154365-Pyramimonas_sp.AAC.1
MLNTQCRSVHKHRLRTAIQACAPRIGSGPHRGYQTGARKRGQQASCEEFGITLSFALSSSSCLKQLGGQNSRRRNSAAGQSKHLGHNAPRAPHLVQYGCAALPVAC